MEQRELEELYLKEVKISDSTDIFREMRDITAWDKEVFVTFNLDPGNRIISREIVSVGILDTTIIHPREVFKTAIARNAKSVIVAHNHPSGRVNPSEEDKKMTSQLKRAGEILGIQLLDHVIVSRNGHFSFTEQEEL